MSDGLMIPVEAQDYLKMIILLSATGTLLSPFIALRIKRGLNPIGKLLNQPNPTAGTHSYSYYLLINLIIGAFGWPSAGLILLAIAQLTAKNLPAAIISLGLSTIGTLISYFAAITVKSHYNSVT